MDPHAGQPVETRGPPPEACRAALVMIHGRNAGPANILELTGPLHHPDAHYVAPAAAGRTWYPIRFLEEIDRNEPGLGSGLRVVHRLVEDLVARGVPRERIILLGFSQGACLTATYAWRHPARFGGVLVLSGGLIGPPGTTWPPHGSLAGTPVFLGCSDRDSHVPAERVEESAAAFRAMRAAVTKRIYPGMGHLVNEDEIAFARNLVERVAGHP